MAKVELNDRQAATLQAVIGLEEHYSHGQRRRGAFVSLVAVQTQENPDSERRRLRQLERLGCVKSRPGVDGESTHWLSLALGRRLLGV
jgi:hypothetical protein